MRYNRQILFLILAFFATLNVFAQASLCIEGFRIKPGETKNIEIKMLNDVPIRALQTRIVLPEELELVSRPTLNVERLGTYTDEFGNIVKTTKNLNYNKWDDGSYMIVVNSDDATAFTGNNGVIISINVRAKESAKPGNVTITLCDIELVYENGKDFIKQERFDCSVSVYDLFNISAVAAENGVVKGSGEYEYGSEVTLLAIPDEGYEFKEWSNGCKENPYKFIVKENVELFATFSKSEYNIIYKVDGEEYKVVPVVYGSEIVLIEEPTKEGHTFSGWSEAPATMPANDITIEGSFAVNTYNVIYKVDGEEYKVIPVVYGSEITLIDAPVREGHTFSGWSESPATMPAKDVTIEGSFAVNTYNVIYKVDGEEYKALPVAYGSEIVLIEAPVKEGHTFSGWSEAPATMPANDVTIEGSFAVNTYNVIYKVDGLEYKVVPVVYGSEIVVIEAPVKEGHTFSGWSEAPATMPAEDVIIEGSFAVNYYTVTFLVDGEVYKVESIAYGSEIVTPEYPVKDGYSFSGWRDVPAAMPAENVEITSLFIVNGYKVTYVVDGVEYQSELVEFGSVITLPKSPTKEGYTFSGWQNVPETMPAEDITIEGTFTVNRYNVIYKVNGEVYATESVAYASEITLIDAPVKEGHTFSGWSEAPATMPANDITIEGSFAVNTYNVIYKVDGEEYKIVPVVYGSEIVLIEAPVKEGHAFSGWSEAPATMPAEDVVIEGSFAVRYYTITYYVDYEVYAIDSVAYGSEIVLRDEPIKEGYTFSGWRNFYPSTPLVVGHRELSESRINAGIPTVMPAYNIRVNGSFTINNYTVTYIVDDEVYVTETVAYGSEIVLIDAPTKEGYTFSGWSEAPATMPANDVTIEGSFTVNTYNVIYKVDGLEYKVVPVVYGSDIVLIDEPTKEGHTFSGWSEAPATMPAKDVTIEGSFAVNTYNVIYKIDGLEYKVVPVTYGSAITLIDTPAKEGHTFSGWSEAPATMPANDVTIEGSFIVNTYSIIYKVDGEEYKVVPVVYGSEIVLIDAPTKEGYTFSGWSEAPATMPANDVTIEGSFIVNTYSIIYKVDGEEYKVVPVVYGSEIVLIEEPTKEGHTFSGWSEAPATMPAKDVTIEGSFAVNTYNVIYKVDGLEYKVVPVVYGSEIVLIEEPTKEGHTFSGWSEAPETMPAEDIVIEGTFTVNNYTVTYLVDGEVYATETVAYGSAITLLEEPTKEGYTFSGWSEAPKTMPAEDIIIEGSFSPITTINGIVYDTEDLVIYNLRGERIIDVDELEQGFYIINGKKVWVK